MQTRKEIKRIPIEEAMELLATHDIVVSQEEAELIMEFIYIITYLVIIECFDIE